MKSILICLTVLALSLPAFAANRFFDLDLNAVWLDPTSNGTVNASASNPSSAVHFKGDLGYGAAANVFFGGNLSAEFAVARVRPKTNLSSAGFPDFNGRMSMVPLTAVLQWHFAPNGFIDPYLGGGAAYFLFNDVKNASSVSSTGVNRIKFKDDAGFAADGGLSIKLGSSFDVHGDVKYIPLRARSTVVFPTGPNTEARIKFNPVIASAGVGFRF
jgi:outer membrane protein